MIFERQYEVNNPNNLYMNIYNQLKCINYNGHLKKHPYKYFFKKKTKHTHPMRIPFKTF